MFMYTSCSKNGVDMTLFEEKLSAQEALQQASNAGIPVIGIKGCESGKDVWEKFWDKVQDKKPASVLVADYYTLEGQNMSEELYEEEKDLYPQLFFTLIEYDGNEFSLKVRKSDEEKLDRDEKFKYLLHLTGNAPETALYESFDRYVLTDESDITWDELERSWYSSQSPDYIRFSIAFEEIHGWRE